MRVSIIAALVILGLACAEAGLFSSEPRFAAEYDQINEKLASLGNANTEDQLSEIRRLSALKTGSGSFQKALDQIAALQIHAKPENCDDKGYALIKANVDATRGNGDSLRLAKRPIDLLVLHLVMKYDEVCYPVYIETIKSKIATLGRGVYFDVSSMVRGWFRDGKWVITPYSKSNLGETCLSIHNKALEKITPLESLRHVTASDPERIFLWRVKDKNENKVVMKDKVEALFNKYIYEPCVEYNSKIGENLKDSVDRTFVLGTPEGPKHKCVEMVEHAHEIGLCYHMVHDKNFRKETLQRVIYSIVE